MSNGFTHENGGVLWLVLFIYLSATVTIGKDDMFMREMCMLTTKYIMFFSFDAYLVNESLSNMIIDHPIESSKIHNITRNKMCLEFSEGTLFFMSEKITELIFPIGISFFHRQNNIIESICKKMLLQIFLIIKKRKYPLKSRGDIFLFHVT